MADVVITVKLMMDSPDTDIEKVKGEALSKIKAYTGLDNNKTEIEPVAFGLKALKILFVMDEAKGATDPLEEQLSEVEGVAGVEVTDVRRAIG